MSFSISKFVTLVVLAATFVHASPIKKRQVAGAIGANYFQTNGFNGNQLVANCIMENGTLVAGSATSTNGTGAAAINDPDPEENHPDPLDGSGSVIVVGNQVMAVNAGSNTFAVFDIDPTDPGNPTLSATLPSNGDFPASLGASPDGKTVCVANGGANNGFSCYTANGSDWTHQPSWDRALGLNLTTPPHGPLGSTVSQIVFSSDQSLLMVAVKGMSPTDLNNPTPGTFVNGFTAVFAIGQDGSLAEEPVKVPSPVPFSITEDSTNPGTFFFADPTSGFSAADIPTSDIEAATTANSSAIQDAVVQGTILGQSTTCWSAQSGLTKNFYTVDIAGPSNVTEISIDPNTLNGTVVSQVAVGVNGSGTDLSIFSGQTSDFMYVNAPGFQAVQAFQISGPGNFSLLQQLNLQDMSPDVQPSNGFAGQAIFLSGSSSSSSSSSNSSSSSSSSGGSSSDSSSSGSSNGGVLQQILQEILNFLRGQ